MKILKTTEGVGYVVIVILVVVLLFVYDSYHSKNFFGLFKPTTATV